MGTVLQHHEDSARLPVVDLTTVKPDPEALALVPGEYALKHQVLPITIEDGAQNKAFGSNGVTGTVENNLGVTAANGQGFRYTLTGGDLTTFINALKSDTKFQVLSTPRIFTSNNVNAEINISQRVPFVTSQRTDANGNITFNYSFEDVGIVLNVTPRITAGGYDHGSPPNCQRPPRIHGLQRADHQPATS